MGARQSPENAEILRKLEEQGGPNPSGLCMCGCGERTKIAKQSAAVSLQLRGHPRRFVHGHHPKRSLMERFMEKWVEGDGGCWLWMAHTTVDGYPRIAIGRTSREAHRVAYELFVGSIPEGHDVHHECEVRNCVNPNHLRPVTKKEHGSLGSLARRTHCKHGHEFTPENTYVKGGGARACRKCMARRQREYQRRKEAAVCSGSES